jgi:hypothetical protein
MLESLGCLDEGFFHGFEHWLTCTENTSNCCRKSAVLAKCMLAYFTSVTGQQLKGCPVMTGELMK